MKLSSHVIAGIGVSSAVSLFQGAAAAQLLYSAVLSLTINAAIDGVGHRRAGSFAARTPATHEILSCSLFSLALGLLVWLPLGRIYGVAPEVSGILSILIGLSHLAGDLVTGAGIYVILPGRSSVRVVRKGIVGARYDDPRANLAYVAIFSLPTLAFLAALPASPAGGLPGCEGVHGLLRAWFSRES